MRRSFGATDVGTHFFRFVILDGTGVGLLLSHPDLRQRVKNGLALYFQFSGEIVNSNLTHPAFSLLPVRSSSLPLGVHSHRVENNCASHGYSVFSGTGPASGSCSSWVSVAAPDSSDGAATLFGSAEASAPVSCASPDSLDAGWAAPSFAPASRLAK